MVSVVLASFSYVHEAQLAKSLLEAKGIQAFIANENIATQNWLYTNAVGGVRLEVAEKDAEAARELLAARYSLGEIQKESESADENPPNTLDVCPNCGSEEIKYAVTRKAGIILSWFVLGAPIFPLGKRLHCEKCGHKWKP